jgi:hypothetical protein
MNGDANDPWNRLFEPKTSAGPVNFRYTDGPQVLPDGPSDNSNPHPSAFFAAMLVAVWLVSLVQGTLAWVMLEYIEDIGWLDDRVPWWPCVAIVAAVNMIRFFDRVAFRRP